jgi:hypothetical protein
MAIQDADLGFRPASSLQLSFQCDHQSQDISRFFQRELVELVAV